MAIWSDVRGHFRGKYSLERDDANMFSMVWEYEDGRTQRVIVRRHTNNDLEHIEVKSAFAKREDVEPLILLEENATLPLVTTCLSGEYFLVIHNLLLRNAVMDDVEYVVTQVARVADMLEKRFHPEDQF